MRNEVWAYNIALRLLPQGACIIKLTNPKDVPAIQTGDMDGDGMPEIAAAYKLRDEIHVMILKSKNNAWHKIADITEQGYNISFIGLKDITGDGKAELLAGFQEGAIWSSLYMFTMVGGRIYRLVDGIIYSMLEIVDIPEGTDIELKPRIALWTHDTGDAYKVDILIWNGNSLVSDKSAYTYYFRKVAAYYSQKVREMPDAAFYWYYLADAQIKEGMPAEALASIEKGLKLNAGYPSREEFIKLRDMAEGMLGTRNTNLYPASVNTVDGIRWGYINNKGEVVINPQYTMAGEFQPNGLAIVNNGDMAGLINKTGKFIVKPIYQSIGEFYDGRAVATDNNGFIVIDERGNEIFKSGNYIGYFSNERAVYSEVNDKWLYGYIDTRGKKIIPAIYESAGNFEAGKAVVKFAGGGYAIIDINGKVIRKLNLAYVGDISEGLLPFKYSDDGKFGFIDKTGNVVIKPAFTGVEGFDGGRAIVNTSPDYGNVYGVIDKKGNFIIKPQYNDIKDLWEGLYAVGIPLDKNNPFKGSKYAIADMSGKLLTDFIYYGVSEYRDGLASAYDSNTTFFIDKSGKKVSNLPTAKGNGTLGFKGDLIRADIDMRTFYYDKAGKVIWKQNTQIPLGGRYMINEVKYRPNRNYLVYYPQISGMDEAVQPGVNGKLRDISITEQVSEADDLDYSYEGNFAVEYYKKNLLVLRFEGYNYPFGAAHGMPRKDYAHLDLVSGRFYELKDLFKNNSDYVKVLSDIIREQIEKQGPDSFVWMDSYNGITGDQPFYINEKGLNIYFYPYEIAPYAAGFPTFTIPFGEIMSIINTQGDFWKSFN